MTVEQLILVVVVGAAGVYLIRCLVEQVSGSGAEKGCRGCGGTTEKLRRSDGLGADTSLRD